MRLAALGLLTGMAALVGAVLAQDAAAEDAAAGPPPELAAQIRALGPVIDLQGVMKIYGPLLAAQPTDGVTVTKDVRYGPDERNVLDFYEPAQRPGGALPILIFFHGGAFQFGDKSRRANIGYFFARHGVVALVPSYRLAPAHQWPAGAEDVAATVRWAKANAASHGADPKRIFLMGESAGGAHVAAAALMRRFQPKGGLGIAGVILNSGTYDAALEVVAGKQFGIPQPDKIDEAYYGGDKRRYPQMSTLLHLDAPKVPVFIIYTELDPTQMQVQAGELFGALCRRDRICPDLLWVANHDHISQIVSINTPDESVSGPILHFIEAH